MHQESVPPFAELTPSSFTLYEAIGLPMILLFVDPKLDNTEVFQAFKCVLCSL